MVTFLFYFTFTGQKYSVTLWTRIINFILPPNWERELLMSRNIKKKPIHWTCSTYLVLSSVTKKKKKPNTLHTPKGAQGLKGGWDPNHLSSSFSQAHHWSYPICTTQEAWGNHGI